MLDRLLGFERALREAGVPVSTGEGLDAMRALEHVNAARRDDFKAALRTTLCKNVSHQDAFDLLFDLHFQTALPEREDPADESLDGLMHEVAEAIAGGDEEALRRLAVRSVGALGRIEGAPTGTWFSYYQVVRTLDLPVVLGHALRAAARPDDSERAALLRREEFERRVRSFKDALLRETRRRAVAEKGPEAVARYAVRPPLEEVGFLSATQDELVRMRRAVRPLARKLAARVALKRRRSQRGVVDMRRTIRRSLSTGGVPFAPAVRHRPPHRPELFVLCDVSGSVARFARFALMLTHSLGAQFERVRSFAFVDVVDEITSLFSGEDFAEAVEDMHRKADVVQADGRSDYGTALQDFAARFAGELSPKSTVLILGDARTNYRTPRDEALAEIAGRARHVYWLSPEPAGDWDTGDSAASVYAARIDKMVEVRNLRQLEDFVSAEL
ncbi:MAG TPA: VWA domain-containing protein [Actinomycetota bacterium]|nr:VWA domain-containing protein [Actinomycetota bacterium]